MPKQVSLVFVLTGRGREALRSSESFFDNSKVRLRCKSKTRPSGSNSWIYGRFAVLRIVSEKILIHAQGSLPRPVTLTLKGTLIATQNLLSCCRLSVVSGNDPSKSPDQVALKNRPWSEHYKVFGVTRLDEVPVPSRFSRTSLERSEGSVPAGASLHCSRP